MEGIDKIFVLNLERRPDRLKKCKQEFAEYTTLNFEQDVTLRKAVDGKSLDYTEYIDKFVQTNDYFFKSSVIGCALSHYDIWREIAGLSYVNRVAVFEDDVKFNSNSGKSFNEVWKTIYNKMPDDCDFLYLNKEDGPINKSAFEPVNEYFTNTFNSGMCTYGYVITKQCAIELVKYIDECKLYCAIDWLMLDFFRNCFNSGNKIVYKHKNEESNMKCYRLINEIVYEPPNNDSDIRRSQDIIVEHIRTVKREVRIFWVFWWPLFSPTCNVFATFLEKYFQWKIIPVTFEECKENPPDIVFSSIFGNYMCIPEMFANFKTKTIIYSGECFRGRTNDHIDVENIGYDLSISYDDYPNLKSHIKMPLWYINIDWFNVRHPQCMGDPDLMPIEWFDREPARFKDYSKRENFCLFVCSDDKCQHRNQLFQELHKVKHVDSAGWMYKNITIPYEGKNKIRRYTNKVEFARNYRFELCPENAGYKGYCSEKLLHAFASGCVPIYWGDETAIEDFNENAFINANSKSIQEVIEEVMRIENDHEAWQKMVSQPVFNEGVNEKYKKELIRGFSTLYQDL